MPWRLGDVGVGAGQQHAVVGEVRPGGPHLLAADHASSSPSRSARVASEARSEPAPGSLNSWHHTSSLRTIGGRKRSRCSSVPWANRAGAARLRPRGLRRPRLSGAQLGVDGPGRRGAEVEAAVGDGPGGHDQARGRRTSGTRPRSRPGCAPRGWRAAPPRAAASRQAAGTWSATQASGRGRRPPPAWRRAARATRTAVGHRPVKRGGRFSRKAARPSRKSSLRDDSSRARASFCS